MPFDPLSMGLAVGLPVVGGAAGYFLSQDDEREADRLANEAAGIYGNVQAPEYQRLESQFGTMPSDFGNQGARNAAIQALMREGLSGGNTLETQLAQAQAQRTAGQATRQAQQGALADAARRGTGGGAATLQAQLLGGSTGADRAAQVGLEGAANARRQALQSLQQGGGLAGQAEESDAARAARRAEALDAMSRFNEGQRQQRFQNEMEVAQRRAGAAGMRSDIARGRGQRTRGVLGGLGQGAGQAATTWGMWKNQQGGG